MKARFVATGLRLRQTTLSQIETRLGNCLPGRLLAKPAAGSHSRDRIYSLSRTFWGWLWQMLNHNASCREVVRQVQALCALQGGPAVDEDTGGYCQARAHLPGRGTRGFTAGPGPPCRNPCWKRRWPPAPAPPRGARRPCPCWAVVHSRWWMVPAFGCRTRPPTKSAFPSPPIKSEVVVSP